ncbi:MAG TPA: glucose-6-phosphate dehydrogenase assembly protein OpcA [Chthoniobacterales bacterium]|nr:glucose-6-phosphate dehydrogenase assembly protein OpcA [Chthoniobacterales bacterium]
MAATTESYSLGEPVEINQIGQALKKLWPESNGSTTRASLINLAVYSEKPGSLEKNTQLLARITENHACRALVIGANRNSNENRVAAWVNAHCHVTHAGRKQICSEQISFSIEGPCVDFLPNTVFSHLDSDLPLYLWWQDEFPEKMDPQLWAWVDRLIFDTQSWKNFNEQMGRVETAQQEAKQRIVLCDLNWTRLDKVRYAIAQFFDHPASHHHFSKIEKVTVDYAPEYKSTAIFFIGWLAAQLNWKTNQQQMNGSCRFLDANNRKIDIELRERAGAPIGEVVIESSIRFCVRPAECGDLLEISRGAENENAIPQMMPGQTNDPVDLLTQELLRGGPHRVYLRAVNSVRSLL